MTNFRQQLTQETMDKFHERFCLKDVDHQEFEYKEGKMFAKAIYDYYLPRRDIKNTKTVEGFISDQLSLVFQRIQTALEKDIRALDYGDGSCDTDLVIDEIRSLLEEEKV